MPTFYQNKGRVASPSKRWQTTTHSALEEVAKQMDFSEQRQATLQDMRERKVANSKTSISFGHDKVQYMSDAQESMMKCVGGNSAEERAKQTQRIKDMKTGLTTTNFKLGDEQPTYLSVNRESMAVAEKWGRGGAATSTASNHAATGETSPNALMEAIKKSSIHFGNEKTQYSSVCNSEFVYRGVGGEEYLKRKQDIQDMTYTLRKHNFTLGDERTNYETDYQRGYGGVPLEAYRGGGERKKEMKVVIEDSRAAHFSLGNDQPVYMSNTHASLKAIEGNSAQDVTAAIENAKRMKAALQKTSFVVGDDEEYY